MLLSSKAPWAPVCLGSEASLVISEHCILQMSTSGCYRAFWATVMPWEKKHTALFSLYFHTANWLHTNFLLGQWQVSRFFLHGLTDENTTRMNNKVRWRKRERKNMFSRLIKQRKTKLLHMAEVLRNECLTLHRKIFGKIWRVYLC